jgi:23S rRNA U2552 (ribose-2'-O)-methylase RlmE/FtsJ
MQALCELAAGLADGLLAPDGTLVVKVMHGTDEPSPLRYPVYMHTHTHTH